uniref:Ig-like domain-containing protein n=1 Tax=Stegastes partitus TaxID=144197 RepID=A0A3B5B4D7_9TELE
VLGRAARWIETIIKNEGLGQNVTLRCSTTPVNKYKGMYLYHKLAEEEEVFYYQKDNKISPRQRYDGRIQTTGPLADHSITISNLTVEDSGLYTCTYTEGVNKKDGHSVYAVFVAGGLLKLDSLFLKVARIFLRGVSMFSPCSVGSLRVLRLPPTRSKNMLRLIGDSKLSIGVNVSVLGCLSLSAAL